MEYVARNAPKWFRSVGAGPEWLPREWWQYNNGGPVLFIGQIAVLRASGYFSVTRREEPFSNGRRHENRSKGLSEHKSRTPLTDLRAAQYAICGPAMFSAGANLVETGVVPFGLAAQD